MPSDCIEVSRCTRCLYYAGSYPLERAPASPRAALEPLTRNIDRHSALRTRRLRIPQTRARQRPYEPAQRLAPDGCKIAQTEARALCPNRVGYELGDTCVEASHLRARSATSAT